MRFAEISERRYLASATAGNPPPLPPRVVISVCALTREQGLSSSASSSSIESIDCFTRVTDP